MARHEYDISYISHFWRCHVTKTLIDSYKNYKHTTNYLCLHYISYILPSPLNVFAVV